MDDDLEGFFDRVQYEVLMARVARKVDDLRVLRLIRRYLDAGVMVSGVKLATEEGTPQGLPLSPLLANVLLDELDRELERRGHRYVRYADDGRVHVKTERAGRCVLTGITEVVQRRLKLRVSEAKSSVRHAAQAVVLGLGFDIRGSGEIAIRLAPKALHRMSKHISTLTGRSWPIAMPERVARRNRFIGGWCAYFALAETPSTFEAATSGYVGDSDKCDGRSGNGLGRGGRTYCVLACRPSSPACGAEAAKAAGGWPRPVSNAPSSPPTGTALA